MNDKWYRVTRKRPCAICGRPDWCGYTDGAGLCMRVESEKQTKNGGWLHKTEDRYIPPTPFRKAIEDPPLDAQGIWQRWFDRTDYHKVDALGTSLGVDTDALRVIGCAWADREWQLDLEKRPWASPGWAFPMRNGKDEVIGIRIRTAAGKWAVKGSRSGLFLPTEYPFEFEGTLWILEGPTDLAAALTMGLYSIGRPSCQGQEEMVLSVIRSVKARRVVIITDNDQPDKFGRIAGLDGPKKLQDMLPVPHCMYIPPTKDIREFLAFGGTRTMIESCIKDTVWTRPREEAA